MQAWILIESKHSGKENNPLQKIFTVKNVNLITSASSCEQNAILHDCRIKKQQQHNSDKSLCFSALSGWKCQKCEMRENLWLNLTDGAVLCGKWFFDGSGGNGHALEHYRETNYPLAVKLDTITPDGAGLRHMARFSKLLHEFRIRVTTWR